MFDLEIEDCADTFVPVAECARVMNLSEDRARQLIKLGVLRSRHAWGSVTVQPAAVVGHTV
jgi:hypothetical protein